MKEHESDDMMAYLYPACVRISEYRERRFMQPRGSFLGEACIGAMKAIGKYDASKSNSLWDFGWRMIERGIIDAHRTEYGRNTNVNRKVGVPIEADIMEAITPHYEERAFGSMEDKLVVKAILDELTPKHRLVLLATYVEGCSLQEVGERLGLTESRICQIRKQALTAAREVAVA